MIRVYNINQMVMKTMYVRLINDINLTAFLNSSSFYFLLLIQFK
jgi:hypothetical protein